MAEDVFGLVGSVLASVYHVERVVAEGGFGVVYRAQHAATRTQLALELLEVPAQNPEQRAGLLRLFRGQAEPLIRFSESQRNLARLLHVDAFTSKDGRFVLYLVLEWLEGMTLEALIEQRRGANLGPVPLRKLVRLLTPVACALERAHAFSGPGGPSSLVHGELEPAKLLIAQVAGEELIKLLDFGISKLKSLASRGAARGSQDGTELAFTPAYGAPEQWAPQQYGQTGPWTDVWGLALCLVEAMAARPVIEGELATIRGTVLDAQRRPTPRTRGIDVPDAIEAVFARALALEPHARQPHVGVFWNELVAALDRPEPISEATALARAAALEFDPSSVRRPMAAPARVSAYGIPMSAPARAPSGAPAAMRATAVSPAYFVPDLEFAAPPASRRASGERPVAHSELAAPSVLDLDSVSLPAALDLDLDLDLPADEPRVQRSVSSQRLVAVQPNALRSSNPPPSRAGSSATSGAMAAVRDPQLGLPTSGVISTRTASPDLHSRAGEPPSSARTSRPPRSADVSASFEAGFVAKIEPKALEERSLSERLRPAIALLGTAILLAIFDPIYAAVTGEVLAIAGQRLRLLAGALLLLALGFAVREATRPQ